MSSGNCDFAKEHFGKGEEKGHVEARRDDVLVIVEERGLALTDQQRDRIRNCDDLDQLGKWFKAAINAKDADDLFA